MKALLVLLRLIGLVIFWTQAQALCPEICVCDKIKNSLKVKCGGSASTKITSMKELDFAEDTENIVALDLGENQISNIIKDDFANFTNLRRLDLSNNSLRFIDDSMFGDIPNLEKLKLAANLIVHIYQGSFENLKMLKVLDISNNPLACDCDLIWLVAWSNALAVKLYQAPKCETPIDFKGSPLKKLRVGSDLHCESPLQPLLELKPDADQLVFEGDEIVLRCRAPRVAVGAPKDSEDLPARAHVFWGWSEKIVEPNSTDDIVYKDPTKYFPSIQIDAKHLSDSGLLDSILRIPSVTRNHTGLWDCRLRSQQANLSRTIAIMVISEKTKYCPALDVHNNKGKYFWPRTIRGQLVRQPCLGEALTEVYATYFCNDNGEWVDLNTSLCPFISENTKILEQFAKVNLSLAKGSVLESAKRLRNYTQFDDNLRRLRDPIDIVFITRTLRNYLVFVRQEKDLGSMLLDIVSQLLILPERILHEAQAMDGCGVKLINAVEIAAQFTPYIQHSALVQSTDIHQTTHKPHLSIDFFNIRSDSFTGMSCTWIRSEVDDNKRIFQCNAMNQTLDIFGQHIDASIQIPPNFLHPNFAHQYMSQKLMVAVYENGNFLPHQNNDSNLLITSVVIGAKIISDSENIRNVSEPISLMLRVRAHHNKLSAPVPAWWDSETNSWSSEVCQNSYYYRGLLVFTCNRLGYYGLLQNRKHLNDFIDENAGARFRYSPLGFYIGCSVLFVCVWINIVTYITFGRSIQMARRHRHSLVNTWLAISALSFIFALGIYQTEDYKVCQIIGISIHYLSLCVILWVCVSVSNMYKRLSKRNRLPMEDLPKENIGSKPILGIYLVGWGIGMIICGISGAVNMREYASYSHCFLDNGPSLSAIFVPSVILLLFLAILFICVRCHIRTSLDHNGHFSEITQGTENVDLELLESIHNAPHHHYNPSDRYRSLSLSNPSTSMLEDVEHTNLAQLRAHFVFLFLYIVCWISAASSVATPFKDTLDYEEEAFSIIFAITCSILGIFLLVFYSISRSDVRFQWSQLSCRNFCCCRSRNISDHTKEINTTVTYHQTCETVHSASRSNSQCSKNRPPSSRSNHLKGEMNRIDSPSKLLTPSASASIVQLNRQQYVHNPVILTQEIPNADIFYNPNQINVARKFFKKQKRLAKRNNFELQRQMDRCDYGDGMSDISSTVGIGPYHSNRQRNMSIFSTGSKVNNTNIHVRGDVCNFSKEARQQSLNPNILSDSCNESDMIVDAERLVLGAEGMRALSNRSKMNNNEMVANIYTNVPETAQPQHEIVTMRADDKFRKSLNVEKFLEQDEIDMERNDLNSQNDRNSTPLYVNGNIRNIITNRTAESSCVSSVNTSCSPSNTMLETKITEPEPANLTPIDAMNTIGLPSVEAPPLVESSVDTLNTSSEENTLDLDKNETYVSESIQIADRAYYTGDDAPIRISHSKKSKSMLSLNAETSHLNGGSGRKRFVNYSKNHVRSISCSNLSQIGDEFLGSNISNPVPIRTIAENRPGLSSPILFSPSLCEINDLPSPQDRRKPLVVADDESISLEDALSEVAVYSQGSNVNSDSLNMFALSIRRTFASSPACESDLNYQNSELSIRSHGLYAPQPDNDLNLTLTGDVYYPYQSSEVSEIDEADNDFDEENDFDDFNSCSNDCLLPSETAEQDHNRSHASLDELYEQITRRSISHTSDLEGNAEGSSIISKPCDFTEVDTTRSSQTGNSSYQQKDTTTETVEDDSSQDSIISYIDPNGRGAAASSLITQQK
ncbi:adhesion G protein-coupled receptor A3 [Episyrphus balteatus]|uniref:adhesion G protein-coupled receptor A3 n=1 Tax=Episyrphus balteatus TaxID=286459 RepID=UPI0024857848|nr:adhesion G protein-coupled receptor A3 [Episyrphus balteatus]